MTLVLEPHLFGLPGDFNACRPVVLEPVTANRRLLEGMLCTLEVANVAICVSQPQTWRVLENGEANLLFLDWSQNTDAMAFLRHLRAKGSPHRFLPVVVISGFAGLPQVVNARDQGATEYMLKPFTIEVVRSRLYSIVRKPRLYVESENFFGPDRRRRSIPHSRTERRNHANWRCADRRLDELPWQGRERRQSRTGFDTPERRTDQRGSYSSSME